MKLIVRKFERLKSTIKELQASTGDMIGDVVVAMEIGFVEDIDNRQHFHNHLFCFHYCVDKYENTTNVSFEILEANQQTGQYCFWDYGDEIYKPSIRTKKIQIENAKISVPISKINFDIQDKSFSEIVDLIKNDLWNTHIKILSTFKEHEIKYDYSMDLFSKELKEYINYSYVDLLKLELSEKIKRYEAQCLENKLNKELGQNNISKPKTKI